MSTSNTTMTDVVDSTSPTCTTNIKSRFLQWQQECVSMTPAAVASTNETKDAQAKHRRKLFKEASRFFASIVIPDSNSDSSSNSHEQALALLIQSLQPAFLGNQNHNTDSDGSNSNSGNTSQTTQHRIHAHLAALACLQGALRACRDCRVGRLSPGLVDLVGNFLLPQIGPLDLNKHRNQEMDFDNLDNDVDEDIDVDIDALEQEVRDSSLETMKLLLQTTTTSQTTTTTTTTAASSLPSSASASATGIKPLNTMISLTCRLAQAAVQRRCAEGEYSDDQGYNQLNDRQSLSLLPRSKRAACFDVLRAAVDSLNTILSSNPTADTSQQNQDDADTVHNFALFCLGSLVGESDPRCLLQLLQLLSALQEVYACATTTAAGRGSTTTKGNSIDDGSSFPVIPLFNAVAPYYPIQFTPPPNNIHGITKQALQTALWDVLSCTKNDHHGHDGHDSGNTMFSLTLGIVLERLVPPDPDDPPSTPEEQLEALEDLTNLLQLSSNDDKDTAATALMVARRGASMSPSSTSSRLDWMHTTAMKQLSETLRTVHDRSSLVVAKEAARGGGEGAATTSSFAARVNKQVADTCRTLVGRIAFALECETTNCNKSNRQRQQRWQAFVADLVQNQLAPKLLLLGDYGSRAAIAYMACLAGCGGIKTLRLVLQCGLHPLIDVVVAKYSSNTPLEQDEQGNKNEKDDASIAIAISGIAAFLVSTHVTLSKMQQQGIVLTPHPLLPHATRMLNVFSKIILSDNHANNDIRIAAVRAVEAVLLTVPAQVLFGQTSDMNDAVQSNSGQTTIMETIVQLFQVMTDAVVVSVHAGAETTPDENTCSKACAETLGRVLGKVLEENPQVSHDDDDDDSGGLSTDVYVGILQDNHTIRGFLLDSVLTALLASASVPTTTKGISNRCRYDRMTLAMSAGSRSSAAARILQPLLQELLTLVQSQEQETEPSVYGQKATTCAQTISFILSNGGGAAAAMAFQQDSMTSILLDIIKALANQAAISTEEGGMEAMFRMSKLKLPPTEEDENLMFELVERGRDLLLPLLSGYSFATIVGHRERLGQAVANVLPPLNNSDTVRLSLTLPFLATALQQDDSSTRLQETENATLSAIITDLADFALYGDGSSAPSRSFAAVCLHAILVRMDASMTTCPCFELMKTVVIPLLQQDIKSSSSTGRKDFPDLIVKCKEALSFAGLLGSAAACRGGSSAKTADKIVCLLIDLACRRTATDTFSKNNDTPATIDLTLFDRNQKGSSTDLGVGAASAFGSILSCGGSDSLWKQRMCVVGYNELHDNMVDEVSKPSIGAVCVSSYLICSTRNLSSLPRKNGSPTELLTKIILNSLSPPAGADATTASPQCILPTMVKKLVLTAIIKLLCVSPASVTPNLYFIVVGVMRAYASNVPDGPYSSRSAVGQDDTVCKVLALQALETIATVPGAPKDLLGAVKPAVVAILGAAMNEKSSVLRQAAVEVRNAWFVISTASTTGNGAYSFGTTALAGAAEAV